jgi:hypothetical protein
MLIISDANWLAGFLFGHPMDSNAFEKVSNVAIGRGKRWRLPVEQQPVIRCALQKVAGRKPKLVYRLRWLLNRVSNSCANQQPIPRPDLLTCPDIPSWDGACRGRYQGLPGHAFSDPVGGHEKAFRVASPSVVEVDLPLIGAPDLGLVGIIDMEVIVEEFPAPDAPFQLLDGAGLILG